MEEAFHHLRGTEQKKLKKKALHILQKQHLELGKFKTTIGVYTYQNSSNTTAENAEIFYASPFQQLNKKNTLFISSILAKKLKQESVAVFIPNKSYKIAHLKVIFKDHKHTIQEVAQIIHQMPDSFSKSYTLHLKNVHLGYHSAEVHSVEWIGNNLNSSYLKNRFPSDKVLSEHGEAYLIFNNGKYEKIPDLNTR